MTALRLRRPTCSYMFGAARARGRLSALAAVGLVVVLGCAGPHLTTSPTDQTGVSVPTGQNPAWVDCLLEQGFWITRIDPPAIEGDPPGYVLESDYEPEDGMARMVACRQEYAPYKEKTPDELQVIYERWVTERSCLIELGYKPAEPPSLETFISSWRSGPWMPTDGIDTSAWTDAEFQRAKDRCTLEFYTRS
jgi:hypothetical protein